MVNTTLKDKTYAMGRIYGRIPIEVVNNIENRLDAEYVPFYFHDLRTNEIIGFHAFLESLSDSYSVAYNSTQAHGRADAVKNYTSTKRSLSFSFNVVSTSEDDFDEMWAKINKLVTLLYPQYTKGVLNVAQGLRFNSPGPKRDFIFEQPFSQVVGGTPLIRLRIGDVVKSNYSRFNLSRLFGAGAPDTGATPSEGFVSKLSVAFKTPALAERNITSNPFLMPLLSFIGSPVELGTIDNIQSGWASLLKSAAFDLADLTLKNGFVNPLMSRFLARTSFQTEVETLGQGSIFAPGKDGFSSSDLKLPDFNGRLFLKPRSEPYVFKAGGKIVGYVKVTRPQLVEVKGLSSFPAPDVEPTGAAKPVAVSVSLAGGYAGLLLPETFIRVPTQPGTPVNNPAEFDLNATCDVTLDECLFDPDAYFNNAIAGFMIAAGFNVQALLIQGASSVATNIAAASGYPVSTNLINDFVGSYMRQFTAPAFNPITNTMEGSMSRGLAGVITSMQFNWIDSSTVWDTNWNSRAPTACKITVNFDPIHDISPGLDVYGANRAPVYNVGAGRLVSGDPLPDGGLKSKIAYDRSGAETQLNQSINNWSENLRKD
jgi:hypothetical protein